MFDYRPDAIATMNDLLLDVEELKVLKQQYNQLQEALDIKNTVGVENIKVLLKEKLSNTLSEYFEDVTE